jgi:hypothetical protein
MLIASAPPSRRRVGRRDPLPVRHRAAGAGLRLHARQLAAPHAAVVHPGRGGHQHPDRRRAARVHHRPRRQGGRHRHHPEPQGAGRLLRARRAGHHVPAQAGPGDVTAADIAPPAGVEVHNPDLHIATLNGKGKLEMELTVERGRGYVSAVQNKQAGAGDRPDPGRLDLLAGAQGDLQGRGHPCRAAHRLRPADHRRRDQAVDHAPRRAGVGRQDPGRAVRPGPRAERRRRGHRHRPVAAGRRSWPPTWRCRSRSWTSPSGRTTASSARASTPWASWSRAARPTCSTSATSAPSRSTRSR